MDSKRKHMISVFMVSAFLSLYSSGCSAQTADPSAAETCFIYTDGLLDDLCAIEYLAEKYDHAVIMVMSPDEIAGSQFSADSVQDESSLLTVSSRWFEQTEAYQDDTDLSGMDFYLLAPLTDFAQLLKDEPSLGSRPAVLMAGDEDGPDGAGEEWNAAADLSAYRYVTEHMKDLFQMTRFECESAYEENGYPFEAEFLDEYISKMNAINENICCYDLQAAAYAFKD